ncbi:hypothetical protein ACQ4PT_071191 [Festuca glaucescens]
MSILQLMPPSPSHPSSAVPDHPSTRSKSSMTTPELIEDLIPEILVHVPPDDHACLVHASLACNPWRRLLTDPGFLHRYRALHRMPPMLGFLCNVNNLIGPASRFVSTSSFRPAAPDDRRRHYWHVIATAHGRVLFRTATHNRRLIVWDPVTDQEWWVPSPVLSMLTTYNDFHAAVLCARASVGCDHLDCHGHYTTVKY